MEKSLGTAALSNETFKNLIESVNFMSDKSHSFEKNLQDMITIIKYIKEENKILKDENNKLKNEISFLDKRIYVPEHKAF